MSEVAGRTFIKLTFKGLRFGVRKFPNLMALERGVPQQKVGTDSSVKEPNKGFSGNQLYHHLAHSFPLRLL